MKRKISILLATILVIMQLPTTVIKALPQDTPGQWPSVFTPYENNLGLPIYDPGGDVSPVEPDLTSGIDRGIGNLPSVYTATDGQNLFIRFRLKGDPYDRKGGFNSTVWLVQIASDDGTHVATVGLNGKPTATDYVYIANANGTVVKAIYNTSGTDESGKTVVTGTRIVPAENGHYFLDFQVPITRITEISSVNGSTPVKLFYGSSMAANLSVINKEYMQGTSASFAQSSSIRLGVQKPTVSIDGGAFKTYDTLTSYKMTGTTSVNTSLNGISLVINGVPYNNIPINNNTWEFNLPAEITQANGTYRAVVTVNDQGMTATDEQDITIVKAANTNSITINGGAVATTSSANPIISGKVVGVPGGKVHVTINGTSITGSNGINPANDDTWTITSTGVTLQNNTTYTVRAVYELSKGTWVASTTQQLTYNQGAVVQPISVAITDVTPLGSANPVVKGASSGADKIEVLVDGTTVDIVTPVNGSWSTLALERPLSSGNHTITALATNAYHSTALSSVAFNVTATSISIDNGPSVTINDPLPTLKGSTNALNTATITVKLSKEGEQDRLFSINPVNGKWRVEILSPLNPGIYAVTATVNGVSANLELTIDTTTTVNIQSPTHLATISTNQATITGSSDPRATIDFKLVSVGEEDSILKVASLTANDAGEWSVASGILTEGEYRVDTIATDVFGNEAMDSNSFIVDLDAVEEPALTYEIQLSQTGSLDFTSQLEGYDQVNPENIQVTNMGSGSIQNLSVNLSGSNSTAFEVSSLGATTLNESGSFTNFTIRPVEGLGVGNYTATVTVTGDNSVQAAFNVYFEVTATPTYDLTISPVGDIAFDSKVLGYDSVTPQTLTLTKQGSGDITNINVSLSGVQGDAFEVGSLSRTGLDAQNTDALFTVNPVQGLPVGDYSAIVIVTADQEVQISFNVSFQVTAEVIEPLTAEVPVITLHPLSVTKNVGETATFIVGGSLLGSGTLTYQWQRSTDGGNHWENIDGEIGTSYQIQTLTLQAQGIQLRAVVTNTENGLEEKVYSNSATLTVQEVVVVNPEPTPNPTPNPTVEKAPTQVTQAQVFVNGKAETSGETTVTSTSANVTTEVIVNNALLQSLIQEQPVGSVLSIDTTNTMDTTSNQQEQIVNAFLNGQTVKDMEQKDMVLEVKSDGITYRIPAKEIDMDQLSEQFGTNVALQDIKIRVEMKVLSDVQRQFITDNLNSPYQVVGSPVEFAIYADYKGTTVEVNGFNQFVERDLLIDQALIDKAIRLFKEQNSNQEPTQEQVVETLAKITTAVLLMKDNHTTHIPTFIWVDLQGRYYARINSLTNSTYFLIYNEATFKDIKGHWAEENIINMTNRTVIAGVTADYFSPEAVVSRGDYAATLVTSLGLHRSLTGRDVFSDSSNNNVYYDYLTNGYDFGLVKGIGQGLFAPDRLITREEAFVMLLRSIRFVKKDITLKDEEIDALLATFKDGNQVFDWARYDIALGIKLGIIRGKNGLIAPKESITRAEAIAIIDRYLKAETLINTQKTQ